MLKRIRRTNSPLHTSSLERRTEAGEGRNFLLDSVIPGTVAGFIGGSAMLLFYMVAATAFGQGFWALPKMISSVIWHTTLLENTGFWQVVVGLIIHYGIATGLGVSFALMLPRQGMTNFAVYPFALLYALGAYVVLMWFVAYWAAPLIQRHLMDGVWLVGHLFFAAALPLVGSLRNRHYVQRKHVPAFVRREADVHP